MYLFNFFPLFWIHRAVRPRYAKLFPVLSCFGRSTRDELQLGDFKCHVYLGFLNSKSGKASFNEPFSPSILMHRRVYGSTCIFSLSTTGDISVTELSMIYEPSLFPPPHPNLYVGMARSYISVWMIMNENLSR